MKVTIALSAAIAAGLAICGCGSPAGQAGHGSQSGPSQTAMHPAKSSAAAAPPASAMAAGWSKGGVFHGGGPYSTSWLKEGQTITALDAGFHQAAESAHMLIEDSIPVSDMACHATKANFEPRPPTAADWSCYTGQYTVNIVILGPHAWKLVSMGE